MKKLSIFIFYFLGCILVVRSQNAAVGPETVILPAPDVTAIQRNGNWPMGSFTGTPNINLPLFNIRSGKLQFPVNLSYNSGGIKTNDAGGCTGMGWALNATGVISRNMMGGQVDEHPGRGYWTNFPFPLAEYSGLPYDEYNRIEGYSEGQWDAQPDIFYYSVAGLSGKFVFDTLQNAHFLPYTNLTVDKQIYPTSLTNSLTGVVIISPIVGLTLTDETGTVYQFKDYDFSNSEPWVYNNQDVSPQPYSPDPIPLSPNYIFTWYLTNIISADRKDTIKFTYDVADILSNLYAGSAVRAAAKTGGSMAPVLPDHLSTRTILHNTVRTKILKKITFNTGYIQFYQTTARLDLIGASTLDSIVQFSYKGNKEKSYNFNYAYLKDTSLLSPGQVPGGTPKENIRLFLLSMREIGANGSALPPHQFTYEHSLKLPSKIMGGGDIWGFANGKTYAGIGDSLTSYAYNNMESSSEALTELMTPDFNYAKQGILTAISYPTGGSTSFLYEPHFKESRGRTITTQVCDGNQNIEFTGVDFHPLIPNDPDAPAPRKLIISASTTFNVTVSLDSRYNNFPTYYYVEIRDSATNTLKYTYYKSSVYCDTYTTSPYPVCVKQINLAAGTYYILAKNTGTFYSGQSSDIYCKVSIPPLNCRYVSTTIADSASVGGVRIKETIDIDSVTGQKIAKLYEYGNGIKPNLFTGNYYTQSDYGYLEGPDGTTGDNENLYETEKVVSSNSTYSLTDVSGFYVCYGNVKETQVDLNTGKTNGYTINYYNNDIDDGLHENDFAFTPYPPYVAQSWKRGKLVRTTHYKINGTNQAVPVQDRIMRYSDLKEKSRVYGDAFFTFLHTLPGSNPLYYLGSNNREYISPLYVNHKLFYYVSSYNVLDSTIVNDYDDNGNIASTKTIYTYDTTTLLPSKMTVSGSKNDILTTSFSRPSDYSNLMATDAVTLGIKKLQQNHMLAPEIETRQYRSNSDGSNQRLVGSVFTTYRTDLPLRDKLFATEQTAGLTDFVLSSVSGGAVTKDSRYQQKIVFDGYDGFGNLTGQHKDNDILHAYLWDYQGGYPIAEAVNASSSEIAYTSFEAEGTGNWTIGTGTLSTSGGMTGNNYYSLSSGSTISKSGLSASRSYLVTYWSKNGPLTITGTIAITGLVKRGWTYYQHTLPAGSTSVSISGASIGLDELRLYPTDAQMSTFTYAPLIGQTSACSANSTITYYEYDGLGRLLRIRDMDSNIVKQYDYQYQVPATTQAIWQSNGQLRCKPCPTNGSYITNMQQHQEVDINTLSATYNTTRWVDDGISGSCTAPADWQNTVTAVRCKQVSSMNTGEQEQEQRDLNPCSTTYNQTRWVVTGTNFTACPTPPTWQSNGQLRCKPCPANSNYTTNMQQHQEIDINPQSATYNSNRWVDDGIPGSCVIPPDWQNTTTAVRCQQSGGTNDGYQEQEQKDMNPCSSTYNTTRWTTTVLNATACPYCNSTNCGGANQKCFGATCQIGTHGIVSQTFNGSLCTIQYGWFFSDGSYHLAEKVVRSGVCP